MSDQILTLLSQLFLALSDKTRLRLLSLMASGEVSVGFLAESLGESQPKISRHLAYLRAAGIVSTRRDGKWIFYAIAPQESVPAEEMLAAALRAVTGGTAPAGRTQETAAPYPAENRRDNTYDEPYMSEWEPAELDVFLL